MEHGKEPEDIGETSLHKKRTNFRSGEVNTEMGRKSLKDSYLISKKTGVSKRSI